MPEFLVPPIKPAGVSPQEPIHARPHVRFRRLQNQMKVVAHQTERLDRPIGLGASLTQSIPK